MGTGREADAAREDAVGAALARLSLEEKTAIVAGADMWALPAVPHAGLRAVLMSDGPVGVRGREFRPGDPSVQLPSPTALAATWDPEPVRRAGRLLAQEARRKGVHVLLAPTVNIHRSPRGGRHFECYSEDPLLTAAIGGAYVSGVQDGGVAACVKHFVANDSETDRFTVDVRAGERALREIYLAPFESILATARPWLVMAAYNQVNGASMTENRRLLRDVLKGEWGFDGVVVSDWTATRHTVPAATGGTDVAMPGPATVYGPRLAEAVRSGAVPEPVVDDMARRVLRLAARTGTLDGAPPVVPAAEVPEPLDGAALAREIAARSFVLLRNRDGALPIGAGTRRVAVIGAAAAHPRSGGGGSAQVFPAHVVAPLDGVRAALGDGVDVSYAVGADPAVMLAPAADGFALRAVFRSAAGEVLAERPLPDGTARWIGGLPGGLAMPDIRVIEVTGTFTPSVDGTHAFGVRGVGAFTFDVDGRTLFDGTIEPEGSDMVEALISPPERRVEAPLRAGRPVEVTLRQTLGEVAAPFPFVSLLLGHGDPIADEDTLLDEAVRAAADADTAVVVVATTEDVESEGVDRMSLRLPGRQDELVARVAAVNPRTIVVVNAGSPVLMPWRDDVAAILVTWFPGQEGGAALGDVLTGAAEPGGRLPTTWPAADDDAPVLDVTPVDGVLSYDEGVFVGYRAWQRAARPPAYAFGHGLGYTDWTYESAEVGPGDGDGPGTVRVRVRNCGTRQGREVVQVYLAPDAPDPDRPDRWLAGFATVEAAPGRTADAVIALPARCVQTWRDGGWRTVPGRYHVTAGGPAADAQVSAGFTVT